MLVLPFTLCSSVYPDIACMQYNVLNACLLLMSYRHASLLSDMLLTIITSHIFMMVLTYSMLSILTDDHPHYIIQSISCIKFMNKTLHIHIGSVWDIDMTVRLSRTAMTWCSPSGRRSTHSLRMSSVRNHHHNLLIYYSIVL